MNEANKKKREMSFYVPMQNNRYKLKQNAKDAASEEKERFNNIFLSRQFVVSRSKRARRVKQLRQPGCLWPVKFIGASILNRSPAITIYAKLIVDN